MSALPVCLRRKPFILPAAWRLYSLPFACRRLDFRFSGGFAGWRRWVLPGSCELVIYLGQKERRATAHFRALLITAPWSWV